MKIRNLLVFICFVVVLIGCTTVDIKPTIPPGCENSIIYKNSPWSFVVLSGAVTGAYSIYKDNPIMYKQFKDAARQAEVVLQGNITYEKLQEVPNLSMLLTTQLFAIFRPADNIDKCDKDILINYLNMI